jgi:hypothetical protein
VSESDPIIIDDLRPRGSVPRPDIFDRALNDDSPDGAITREWARTKALVSWLDGWVLDEQTANTSYGQAARDIADVLARYHRDVEAIWGNPDEPRELGCQHVSVAYWEDGREISGTHCPKCGAEFDPWETA